MIDKVVSDRVVGGIHAPMPTPPPMSALFHPFVSQVPFYPLAHPLGRHRHIYCLFVAPEKPEEIKDGMSRK